MEQRQEWERVIAGMRPELHRYCARMLGSTIDGEDIVQDVLMRAQLALAEGEHPASLRPWLFRVAHNCLVDRIRSEALRRTEPMEEAEDVADQNAIDALEEMIRRETVTAALSRFVALPVQQRAAVILKDVLDHRLEEIGSLLDCSIPSVKAALHRGRMRLAAISSRELPEPPRAPSAELLRYVDLFNRRDWNGLRATLARDVSLVQTARAELHGADAVAEAFFNGYDAALDWHLVPAWLEGREMVLVLDSASKEPAYFTLLSWRDGLVARIHDFRHARYVMENAEVVVLPSGHRATR